MLRILLTQRGENIQWILARLLRDAVEDVNIGRCGCDRWERNLAFNSGHVIGHKQTPEEIVPQHPLLPAPLQEQNTGCAETLAGVKFQVNALLAGLQG